jgi:BMFP domain-containing protein YqiC
MSTSTITPEVKASKATKAAEEKKAEASRTYAAVYNASLSELRVAHQEEFEAIVLRRCNEAGIESPAAKRKAAAARKEQEKADRIARLEAQLAALKGDDSA